MWLCTCTHISILRKFFLEHKVILVQCYITISHSQKLEHLHKKDRKKETCSQAVSVMVVGVWGMGEREITWQ